MNKRYFMFSYQAFVDSNTVLSIGTFFLETDEGMPTKDYLIYEISKDKSVRSMPVIFNIFEFKNEEDYKKYLDLD